MFVLLNHCSSLEEAGYIHCIQAPLLKPWAGNGSGMRNVRMRKSGSSGALYTCLIHIKTDSLFHHTYALVPSACVWRPETSTVP